MRKMNGFFCLAPLSEHSGANLPKWENESQPWLWMRKINAIFVTRPITKDRNSQNEHIGADRFVIFLCWFVFFCSTNSDFNPQTILFFRPGLPFCSLKYMKIMPKHNHTCGCYLLIHTNQP